MPHPFQALLDPEAVAAVARARTRRHAVWLIGGPGAGAYALARSLHREGDAWGFVSVRLLLGNPDEVDRRLRVTLETTPHLDAVGLYVERVERQPLAVQEQILRLVDEGLRFQDRSVPLRLFAQSDILPRIGEMLAPLRHRLSGFVIRLPALAEHRAEIPAFSEGLVRDLAAELGLPAPALEESALRALAAREWPGGVEELEAVLTRVVASGKAEIDAGDLTPGTVLASATAGAPAKRGSAAPGSAVAEEPPLRPRSLEILLAELAHELKNPMVTIKTFAEQFDRLATDKALREKFVKLAGEAVERMDRALEQLLSFSRFGEPSPRKLSLRHLVHRAVASGESTVRDRVRTNGIPAEVHVRGDEDQLAFALHSVARSLLRGLPAEATVTLDCTGAGDVIFRGWAKGAGNKLLAVVGEGAAQGFEGSLDFVMADALVRRNGGSSRVTRGADGLEVRLQLSAVEGA